MNKLQEIVANKRSEVAAWKAVRPLAGLKALAAARGAGPDFAAALVSRPVGLIAEVKRRSPSVGLIRDPFDPPAIARAYEAGGAQALSVLMDEVYFGGGEGDFRAVRDAVALPLLYKEFVVDAWQVWHAASLGASAVLLIVAALDEAVLAGLMDEARAAGLAVLMEVHDADEAAVAVRLEAGIIGINNRNLKTFVTDLATTAEVIRGIPDDRVVVSESGIRDAGDVQRVRALGVDAILVGEHLLRKDDLAGAVRAMMEPVWMSS
ncbi:MAG TPA: indole-3-glycerol phosphate synthase TrpC [Kiritimatiellia bacterium]|nr:indole-3-glycerol phosphate synthase TrpC [Kiritimatiellia bacterium]HMP34164.1 indole-3-glycerol phosphate synthase TrpC [Kiritimatiellia bacterium]